MTGVVIALQPALRRELVTTKQGALDVTHMDSIHTDESINYSIDDDDDEDDCLDTRSIIYALTLNRSFRVSAEQVFRFSWNEKYGPHYSSESKFCDSPIFQRLYRPPHVLALVHKPSELGIYSPLIMHNDGLFINIGLSQNGEAPGLIFSRAHKKSRRGCKTCKTRKVKCDETRPACLNCTRRCPNLLSCDYPPDSERRNRAPNIAPRFVKHDFKTVRNSGPDSNSTFTSPSTSIDIHPVGITDTQHRRLEMRLLHHFTTQTSQCLPTAGTDDTNRLWTATVPQLGFISDLVLEGLMAFSALHLHSLCPNDVSLSTASTRYISKTIMRQRLAINQLSKSDPSEVFTAALFIFHYTWLSENRTSINETPYRLPTKIYQLARASKELFISLPEMNLGHYEIYCPRIDLVRAKRPHPSPFIESGLVDIALVFTALESYPMGMESDRVVLRQSLQVVEDIINMFTGPEPFPVAQNVLALLPLRTSERFVSLLEEEHPFAMAVLAWNFALIHAVRVVQHVWWMHGSEGGELAKGNVRGILGLMPDGLKWMVEWPMDVVEGKVVFDL
ncbi:hypothetical protein DL98DRAFT_588458 [Cadophora sp. DSE1049]|nr:hypothetical protein DL98DRAFT_588458 [Cadophora sp. DSE1049]